MNHTFIHLATHEQLGFLLTLPAVNNATVSRVQMSLWHPDFISLERSPAVTVLHSSRMDFYVLEELPALSCDVCTNFHSHLPALACHLPAHSHLAGVSDGCLCCHFYFPADGLLWAPCPVPAAHLFVFRLKNVYPDALSILVKLFILLILSCYSCILNIDPFSNVWCHFSVVIWLFPSIISVVISLLCRLFPWRGRFFTPLYHSTRLLLHLLPVIFESYPKTHCPINVCEFSSNISLHSFDSLKTYI